MTFIPQTPPELEADTIVFLNDLAQNYRSTRSAGDGPPALRYQCNSCTESADALAEIVHEDICPVGKAYALLRRYQQRVLEEARPPSPWCGNQQPHDFRPFTLPISATHPAIVIQHVYACCSHCLATYELKGGSWHRIATPLQERTE